MTLDCGDSHTSTHRRVAALAFIGIRGRACIWRQCLLTKKTKSMLVKVEVRYQLVVTAKDIIPSSAKSAPPAHRLYAIEFGGSTIRALSMEGRMTICNMAIEAGARAGMVAVDDHTIDYEGPSLRAAGALWDQAVAYWRTLVSDADAKFDCIVEIDASTLKPHVTWGTPPEMVVTLDGCLPDPAKEQDPVKREGMQRALQYMALQANTPIKQIAIDKVFIGSCTNSRIEDLRAAAQVARGKHVASNVKLAMVVPGSGLVKRQAEQEGLDKIFLAAGFEWREPGCSMCLAMNADRLEPGERCASTSNRNFEGRQGPGGRTHLVSPAMAAAAAIAGHLWMCAIFAIAAQGGIVLTQ